MLVVEAFDGGGVFQLSLKLTVLWHTMSAWQSDEDRKICRKKKATTHRLTNRHQLGERGSARKRESERVTRPIFFPFANRQSSGTVELNESEKTNSTKRTHHQQKLSSKRKSINRPLHHLIKVMCLLLCNTCNLCLTALTDRMLPNRTTKQKNNAASPSCCSSIIH